MDKKIRIDFGYRTLLPYRWVRDGDRMGLQYVRIDHDKDGREVSRKVLKPAGWLRYG